MGRKNRFGQLPVTYSQADLVLKSLLVGVLVTLSLPCAGSTESLEALRNVLRAPAEDN